jgi:hypothetical protein
MNKKQKEAKRKNAQAHLKKVKDLVIQREEARAARGPIQRSLPKAEHVAYHPPAPLADQVEDVFAEFFAKKLKADGLVVSPSTAKEFLTAAATYPYPLCK